MSFITCLICCEERKGCESFFCQCKVCISCLSAYLKNEIERLSYKFESIFRCPGGCYFTYSLEEIITISKANKIYDEVDAYLLKTYLVNAENVRQCPRSKCGYSGMLPSENCNGQLVCDQCGENWYCLEIMPVSQKMFRYVSNMNHSRQIMTDIYELVFTNSCPKCGIPIYKNGGCSHMTCVKCSHEFCWYCKSAYIEHSITMCSSHMITYYGIILNLIFNILVYQGYHIILKNLIFFLISVIFSFIIHNSIIYIFFFVLKYSMDIKYRFRSTNPDTIYQRNRSAKCLALSLFVQIVMLLIVLKFTEITLTSWFWYLATEIMYVGCFGGSGVVIYRTTIYLHSRWFHYIR